jgi:glycosyltransferase involved in cell wall biosynthesis
VAEQYATSHPKLLVLASTYPRWAGDAEPGFVHELARRLVDQFDVTVICPHAKGAARQEVLDGVRVVRYRYAPDAFETLVNDGGIIANLRRSRWKWLLLPSFFLAQWVVLLCLLRKLRPDVVHAHWLIPQGLLTAIACTTTPFVVTSHGADLFALRGRPLTALKRWVVRRAAAITVVSRAMQDELLRIGADTSKVTIQPMGVDMVGRFSPDPAVISSATEILFVGRFVEKKGLRYLIDAMPEILIAVPQAKLTIVGFGPEEVELRNRVQRFNLAGKVSFIGPISQEDLPEFYRRAAVFAAPFVQAASGDQEGLGLVCVEAIGCGCPIVISDLPATRDVFDGSEGCVRVEPGNSIALAGAVVNVLSHADTCRRDVLRQRELVFQKFDWHAVSKNYANILDACIRVER